MHTGCGFDAGAALGGEAVESGCLCLAVCVGLAVGDLAPVVGAVVASEAYHGGEGAHGDVDVGGLGEYVALFGPQYGGGIRFLFHCCGLFDYAFLTTRQPLEVATAICSGVRRLYADAWRYRPRARPLPVMSARPLMITMALSTVSSGESARYTALCSPVTGPMMVSREGRL